MEYDDSFEIRKFDSDKPLQTIATVGHCGGSAITDTLAIVMTDTDVYCTSIDSHTPVPVFHATTDCKALTLAGETLTVDHSDGTVTSETHGSIQTLGTLPKYHFAQLSPDGSQIAFQEPGQCRILDCANHLAEITRFDLPKSSHIIEFCSPGRVAILNDITGFESILDFTGKLLWQFRQSMGGGYPRIFDDLAISGDAKGRCVLWALAERAAIKHLGPAGKRPLALAITGDGRLAAVGFKDSPVQLIDTASGAAVDVPDSLHFAELAFCGKDQFLVITKHDGLTVWDVHAQRSAAVFTMPIGLGSLAADATYPQCFVRLSRHVLEVAERNGSWEQQSIPTSLDTLAIDSDGHGHLVVNYPQSAEIWETRPTLRLASTLHSETDLARNVAFVDDGRKLVAQDALSNLQAWTSSGVPLGTQQAIPAVATVVSGSASSMTLLRQLNQLILWDAGTNEIALTLPIDHAHTALSSDGKSVLVGTSHDGVSLLRLDSPERFRTACSILSDPIQNKNRQARQKAYGLLDLDVRGW